MSSLYVNTLLCNLNARDFVRRDETDYESYSMERPRSNMLNLRGRLHGSGSMENNFKVRACTKESLPLLLKYYA